MSFIDAPQGDDLETEDPNADLAADEGGYTAPDVEQDQDAIAQQIFAAIAAKVPGWQAHDGNLDTWLIESWAEIGAEIRSLAAAVPLSIFTYYGQNILGVPPNIDLPANGLATFTAIDDLGYTVEMGTQLALARSGDDLVAFSTNAEAVIAPGSTVVPDVPIVALETGGEGNGLTGSISLGSAQMVSPLTWVADAAVVQPTYNGTDAETPDAYVDRLTNLMRTMAIRPILPQDFAILALQNDGIGRAVAMNLYDPTTDTWTNERTVTLMVADINGLPIGADAKADLVAQIEALREVNWIIHVIDPTYVAIDVAFDVTAFAGQDEDTVLAACTANVEQYLNPATFRLGVMSPATAGGEVILPPDGTDPARKQVVRVNELIAILDRSKGVDYVNAVDINGSAADFTMPDAYTLPQPGAITGTVQGAAAS